MRGGRSAPERWCSAGLPAAVRPFYRTEVQAPPQSSEAGDSLMLRLEADLHWPTDKMLCWCG